MAGIGKIALAAASLLTAGLALAQGAADLENSDWLIARRDGQWQLVAKGARGRVQKDYLNQEVLRFDSTSATVLVVTMPPIGADDELTCLERARRDAKDPCSSAFLSCRANPGDATTGSFLLAIGSGGTATDWRNKLTCRADVDAILRAAKDVGMIKRILPVAPPAE